MARNRLSRGERIFPCSICGRNCRLVSQPIDSDMCMHCYDLAGLQNIVYDGGFTKIDALVRDQTLVDGIYKGGDEARIRKTFKALFEATGAE